MKVNAQRNPSAKAPSPKAQTSSSTAATPAVSVPPVLVKNIDEPARQPFASAISYIWNDGSAVVQEIFVVPAHKRLVIEFLSATTALQPDQKVSYFRLALTTAGVFGTYTFPAQAYPEIGGGATFLSTQSMRLYADPGSQVLFLAVRDSNGGSAAGDAYVSGYLVDLP